LLAALATRAKYSGKPVAAPGSVCCLSAAFFAGTINVMMAHAQMNMDVALMLATTVRQGAARAIRMVIFACVLAALQTRILPATVHIGGGTRALMAASLEYLVVAVTRRRTHVHQDVVEARHQLPQEIQMVCHGHQVYVPAAMDAPVSVLVMYMPVPMGM
jgi:hypothetical protein